jgi:hypothetical protein
MNPTGIAKKLFLVMALLVLAGQATAVYGAEWFGASAPRSGAGDLLPATSPYLHGPVVLAPEAATGPDPCRTDPRNGGAGGYLDANRR